jgi:hypothetical protein
MEGIAGVLSEVPVRIFHKRILKLKIISHEIFRNRNVLIK